MANYTKSTDFAAKDSLSSGDSNKVVRGTEFETEFDAISTAIATKSDIASPTFTGTTTIPTVDINGGAIDGTTIGAASAGAGTFTNLTASTSFTLNGVAITSTAAELNILDGVTSTASELNLVDGSSAGTIVNSKSVIYGSSGEVNATTLQIAGTAITSSAAELNILDGVTSTTDELNILDGVTSTASELNVLDGVTSFLDEDDLSSDSATSLASQQSIKAYVDAQTGGGGATLAGLSDTNVTSPADAALLFYDTGTSKWIDNVVSGDVTIADTGVASIGSGVIVNADVNASAAIDVSKTALSAGTGLTLTTNTLSVDAAQTQITSVGTLSSLSVSGTLTLGGTAITSTAAELNILDGVTASTAELNILDGVTSTAAELNILDGVTATASELNILDGVTSTTAELNILDGVTSTATELNLVDGSTADTVVNSKAVIYGAAGQITANELDVDNIQLDANAIKSTDTNGNIQLFPNGTGFTELYGNTNAGTIRFNCENNSHGVTVQGPAHSAAATYTVKLPDSLGTTQASGVVATDASAKVKFIGTTSVAEMIEKVTTQTSTTGTINFDFLTQAVEFYTANQTANRTINFRGDGSTALNAVMATGESMTAAILMTQGSSAYYLNTYQVDGSSVTPEWSGGSAPSSGNASSIDSYVFTIIKTADATFTVLASQTQYA